VPLCLLVACQDEPTMPETGKAPPISFALVDNVVASVSVTPDSQMVFVGDRFTITASPKNAAGQLLTRNVKWTVATRAIAKSLDSLKPTMTFKALRAGTTLIKATVDGKSRSAKVVVRSFSGAKVVVTPSSASVVAGSTVKFVATGLTSAGETAGVNVTWTATGGTVSSAGTLTAGQLQGAYRIIAKALFGAADTSAVTITAATAPAAKVVLVPATTTLAIGTSVAFFAYARTSTGDSVAVAVTYTATGGTVASTGVYTAGRTTGNYRVIAKNAAGSADTSDVVISAAPLARVGLLPELAASRANATTRFTASMWNTSGEIATGTPAYGSTCGTISADGVFTAPSTTDGSCMVTATAEGKSDTTEMRLLRDSPTMGIPFGIFNLWASGTATQTSGVAPFTASHDGVLSSNVVARIGAARSQGIRLVLAMTGGDHELYKTNGVFDMAKWQAAMDKFNTATIRSAVADGVADGTIVGNSVMDEPQQADQGTVYRPKSWGPAGTMTKTRVDQMCAYAKAIFPTLPVGVFHDPSEFQPTESYYICEFLAAQFATRKGSATTYRDKALAMAARDRMSIIFSLNFLDGGAQDKDGVYDCVGTGGLGTYSPNCQMLPQQLLEYGKVLGPAGCALLAWRYDATFTNKPENIGAISELATMLAGLPRSPCIRTPAPNTAPTAMFASSCEALDCAFTDGSSDIDGTVTDWSWDFGDGSVATAQNPKHAYGESGTYQVTLTAVDDDGAESTVTHAVSVQAPPPVNQLPTADFAFTCDALSCSFSDQSTDEDGTVSSWAWDFGDGASSTERNPDHSYEAAGSYSVTLTATDDIPESASVSQTVTVTAPAEP
jgi:PKD repeat protein